MRCLVCGETLRGKPVYEVKSAGYMCRLHFAQWFLATALNWADYTADYVKILQMKGDYNGQFQGVGKEGQERGQG